MRIARVTAFAVRIPRDLEQAVGTAGSPARLRGATQVTAAYRWAETYPLVYSTAIETMLVRLETDEGLVGWGEAQSPVAPQVTRTIIESLLGPLAVGEDPCAPELLWARLYSAMRSRGHTGSFYLDALAAIDIAAWDISGKACGQPVARLFGGSAPARLPVYLSGLSGSTDEDRLACARGLVAGGARGIKIFLDAGESNCLRLLDVLRREFGDGLDLYVDALWRQTAKQAIRFAEELGRRRVGWLESPLPPEDVRGHARVAARADVPIAIGESYRTRYELLPFFDARAVDIVQPDVGRTGLSEGRRILALASAFQIPGALHVSIGLGPQIAAALHLAAATPGILTVECNPLVYEVANRFLKTPIDYSPASLALSAGPGLGIEIDETRLQPVIV